MGYTKLSSELVMSTVWREEKHVRLVWITMLALKDQSHEVLASVPGLADSARVSLAECEDALRVLSAPDAYSRSQAEGGRRLIAIPGGWFVVNGESYRRKQSREEFKEKKAAYMREYRKNKDSVTGTVTNRADCNQSNPIRSDQNKSEQDPPLPSVVTPQGVDIAKDGLDSFVADPRKLADAQSLQQETQGSVSESGTTSEPSKENGRVKKAPRPKATGWRRFPQDFEPDETHRDLATRLGLNMADQLIEIRDHEFAKPKVDAAAAFRTWLRNAPKFGAPTLGAPRAHRADPRNEAQDRNAEHDARVRLRELEIAKKRREDFEKMAKERRANGQ